MKGIFITFEGPDGAGKTTQINMLKEYLEFLGKKVIITREPGGTHISEQIRKVILDPKNKGMNSVCEALLYAASRAQLMAEVIIPALDRGYIVISDRFVDSSIVYQGYARELGEEMVESINKYAILGREPDITFLIMISPEEGIKRKNKDGKLDRLEQENILFHKKVFEGYNKIKNKYNNRIITIDGTLSVNSIQEIIRHKVKCFYEEGIL
jgi:dTMP kinase